MTPLCFVDCETTSLAPDRRVWEVALIRRDDEGQRHIVMQVDDVDLSDADPESLAIGRFYERHHSYGTIKSAAPRYFEADVARHVERWTRSAHLVGAVPSFDAHSLAEMLRDHSLAPAWHHRLICVESLAAGALGRYIGGLTRCAEALGVPVDPQQQHTAMGDARTAMAIWDAVMPGVEAA